MRVWKIHGILCYRPMQSWSYEYASLCSVQALKVLSTKLFIFVLANAENPTEILKCYLTQMLQWQIN